MKKIKVTEEVWAPFAKGLFERTDVETAGVLLAEPMGPVLIVRSAQLVPDEGYEIRRADQLRISPVTLNRMTRPARDRGWSVLTVHTHPGADGAWFSWADDQGDSRLMPSFAALIPEALHGSIVLISERSGIARLFEQGGPKPAQLVIVGRTLWPLQETAAVQGEHFARQALALGVSGQQRLRELHVGVVGLGGTGSAVAVQLVHLGVGAVTAIDGDRVEATNLSRIFGARRCDLGQPKVRIVERYSDELGLGTRVHAVPEHLSVGTIAALAEADVVFCCVDRHTPRALLNQLAYERLVPVIDMGTAFRVDPVSGRMTGDAGRVVVMGPGRRCLACWGHIDPDALRVEAMSAEERAGLVAEGYVQGVDVAQPSVIAFNAQVASAAVVELMRMVTGFAGAEDPPDRLSFSFREGTMRRNRLGGVTECSVCGAGLRSVRSSGE